MAPNIITERFDSWKEIALYLNKDVRTVQRWEKKGLPIHRQRQTGAIFAFKAEIDIWMTSEGAFLESDASEVEAPPAQPANGLDSLKQRPFDDVEVEIKEIDTPIDEEPSKRKKALTLAAALLIVAIGTFLIWKWISTATIPLPARVLVLPFENLSDDPKLDYLARGISDDVISSLAQLQSSKISVVERVTAARYEQKTVDQIGRDLRIDFVTKGTVKRQVDRVRINVQLVQVSDQTEVWANSYDDEIQSIPSASSRIAADLEHKLSDLLTPHQKSSNTSSPPRQARIGTKNSQAYDDFLHGRYFWSKRGVASMGKGMNYFKLAITEDPNFAAAYAGLADGLALLGSAQSGVLPPTKAFPEAKAAAEKALSLDDSLAEAHTSLAYISLVYDHHLGRAKQEFDRAIQLDPSYATAHQWLGLYYYAIGDTKSAIATVTRAKEQDSLSLAVNIALAEAYYFARDYAHAADQAKAALELDPSSALAHYNLGRAYLMEERNADAISEFQQARANSPNAATLAPVGYAYARSGNTKQAQQYLDQLTQLSRTEYVPAIYFEWIYTGMKDKDQAFRWLNKALTERCDYLVFVNQDPMADVLRDDARFKDLLSRLGIESQR